MTVVFFANIEWRYHDHKEGGKYLSKRTVSVVGGCSWLNEFNPQKFVETQVRQIKRFVGREKALVAVSGGVDSTTSAILTYKAIGDNLVCVMLDDAFMREGEAQYIAQLASKPPIRLPIRILNVQEQFLNALDGLKDAEEKRKAFRETFYNILGRTAEKEECRVLVQGTIKADIVETAGGVKTQHNVLEQIGINTVERYGFKVVEPLVSLYKDQVRIVAKYLEIPLEISDRQPFPGPGLSVRVVGKITGEKLDSVKKATVIVERNFARHKPSQYFPAIIEDNKIPHASCMHIKETAARVLNVPSRHVTVQIFEAKATGVKDGKRMYGGVASLKIQNETGNLYNPSMSNLVALQTKITSGDPYFTRILYLLKEVPKRLPYVVILRAIQTQDFLTAKVADIPWNTLNETADMILDSCKNVSAIYYDVTSKPPATVEME
ncbi:MAG: GMP synthase [Candidatus Bathyarchaeota archaeon]|nr:MAG: GMP synthase [Candidatus Bathyarchaeota archaeon]